MVLRRKRKTTMPRAAFPPGWDVPAGFNFTRDVIEVLASKDSLRKGAAYVDREGIVDRRTFSDVAKDAARWAHLLRTRLDRGDRVLVVLGKVPAWHGAMLGALKGGLVSVPCSDMLRARDLAFRVQDSGARLVVADRSCEIEVEEMRNLVDGSVAIVYVDEASAELQRYVPRAPTEDTTAGETAFILYTSGTTKEPKGVVHTHAYTWAQRAQAGHWLDAHEQDVVWCTAGSGWAKSIWNVLLGPWSHGAEVVVHEGAFDPDERLSLLDRLGVTVLCQAPTEYRMLAKLDALSTAHLPRLRHAVSAGEPLNPEVIERFQATLGLTIHDGYGQTENSLLVANAPGTAVRPGSMGLPTPGHEVAVIDESGHVCPPGVEGDIALAGRPPTLFSGYWQRRDETEAVFRGDWYVTGDRATRDEDGYLWFVGRADDVILSAAYRIGPFEVESALLEHPAVAESAVVGVPHSDRGQIVKAFVVLRPGNEGDDALAVELQEHVKAITAPYKYPRAIEFVEALPKTASGKIRRAELRALPYVETPAGSSVVQLPVRRRDEAAEERARAEAEEAARLEAAAVARREAEERARAEAEAEAAARREAEETVRLEAAAVARREAEEQARAEADESARLEAQAAARKAEERERAEAESAARLEAEAAEREAEEAARLRAEATARAEAEERARADAEEAARLEAEAAAREAEDAVRLAAAREAVEREQAEAAAQREVEEEARRTAEEALRRDAEERARSEAAEDATVDAEADAEEIARAQAEEIARVEAEIALHREAAARARLEARAAEAQRRAAEAQALSEAENRAETKPAPSGREARRAAREEAKEARRREAEAKDEAKRRAEEDKRREREEAEQAKRDAEAARQRAKVEAAAAKQRAKEEASQAKLDAEAARRRAKDNAVAAERRAREEAEQRRREEAAAREEARRREEEERARAERQARGKGLTRFLFGGADPNDEFAQDEAPAKPIPGLVERLQRYSGQETIPAPPGEFLSGSPEDAPAEDFDEIPLVEDEESTTGGHRSH